MTPVFRFISKRGSVGKSSISAFCGAGLAYEAPVISAGACGAAGSWAGYGAGWGLGAVSTSSGGGFPTSSASPIPPVGVSVLSENEIGGILAVGGELPFLGTVGLEGVVPTAGAGVVSYGCGNGAVGMVSEEIAGPTWGYPAAAGLAYGPGLASGLALGYGPAIGGRAFGALGGCGCGVLY
ncbi:unnamed protein product, partial [Iphiclides podalirius]